MNLNLAPRHNLGFILFERLASFERAQSSIDNEFTKFHESKQRGGGEIEAYEVTKHQFHKIIPTIDITNRIVIDVYPKNANNSSSLMAVFIYPSSR